MRQLLWLYIFASSLAWGELKLRDAVVKVEIHDRSGRVELGRGVFISGLGEFVIPRTVVEEARENPYQYLMSFKTADDRPLSDVTFSHCDDDKELGLCFYKANYVPYRKIELGKKGASPKGHQSLFFHRENKRVGKSKIELHPNGKHYWSTSDQQEGRIAGTLLLDQKSKPVGLVMAKKLRESNLIVSLEDLAQKKTGNYHAIEQQSGDSVPRDMQKEGHNMARMVGDLTRLSQEELKKAIEQLFVPGGKGARAGIGRKQSNNQLQKNKNEEVMIQAAARGEQARRDFFKTEQQAEDLRNQVKHDEQEVGDLEQKIKGKESLKKALDMRMSGVQEELVAASIKLKVNGDKLGVEEKQQLLAEEAAASKKLDDLKKKSGALGKELENLGERLGNLKKELGTKKALSQEVEGKLDAMGGKQADALRGNATYRGDLL